MAEFDRNEHERWIDPFPGEHGVLLSDMIENYIDRVCLIENYDPECLKPASYGVRLGHWYYLNGDLRKLGDGECLQIPKNSIVYVSTLEKFHLPYYMIGRFDLKINMLYQGLLLGTGPQVDPGFSGTLYCPLHNISNEPIPAYQGKTFATIDFTKTTRFRTGIPAAELAAITEDDLYARHRLGKDDKQVILFPADKKARTKLAHYLPGGKTVRSSVDWIAHQADRAELASSEAIKAVENERRSRYKTTALVGVLGAVGLAVAGFTLVVAMMQTTQQWVLDGQRGQVERLLQLESRMRAIESSASVKPDSAQSSTPATLNSVAPSSTATPTEAP